MKIKIKDAEVELKYKFRSEILFEDVMERTFQGKTVQDWVMYFYCTVVANTSDGFAGYEEFLSWLDEKPETLYEFIDWYAEQQAGIVKKRQEQVAKGMKKKAAAKARGRRKSTSPGSSVSSVLNIE